MVFGQGRQLQRSNVKWKWVLLFFFFFYYSTFDLIMHVFFIYIYNILHLHQFNLDLPWPWFIQAARLGWASSRWLYLFDAILKTVKSEAPTVAHLWHPGPDWGWGCSRWSPQWWCSTGGYPPRGWRPFGTRLWWCCRWVSGSTPPTAGDTKLISLVTLKST